MRYLFALAVTLILALPCYSAETRGLRVTAKDPGTNQTGEVSLYNKSFAVIIGIDQYQNLPADRQLKNAVSDAKGVEEVLTKNYHFDKIIHLYNQDATKDRIMEVLTETLPAQMGDQDSLFLFWAGHGDQEKVQGKEIGYLVPYDGEVGKIRKNLTMAELRDTVSDKLPAKHVFYVMDACYGGLLASTRAVDKQSRRDLAYLKEITKESVRQVLTAGGKGEEVLDGGYKGHSVFTGRLVEALEASGDFITANEIQAILKEKVFGDSKTFGHGKTQTPSFGTLSGSGDYVFVPNLEQKSKDNAAELAKMEAELNRLKSQEAEAQKYQSEQQQRQLQQQRKAVEGRLKVEQLRQQQLAEEAKRQEEMAAERVKFEAEQKQRQQELTASQKAEELRLATLKAELSKRKQASPAASANSLEAAIAEIRRLNAEIEGIEATFGRELATGKERIADRYAIEIAAVRLASEQKQAPLIRDEFETEAEYQSRIAKQQSSFSDRIAALERKQGEEERDLEQRITREQQLQSADLRSSLNQIADKKFSIGGETLALEIGQYNPDKQAFPVTIRNKTQNIKVAMNGTISLPRESARKFKQEYTTGLVRPQATVTAGSGDVINVALANDSDSSLYEYVAGEFMTVAERKRREAEREREREREKLTGKFVDVPGGCFTANGNQVCLDAFRIGKFDVTQGQYQRIMGSNPSYFRSCGDDCPVESVSWDDAQSFISKLSSQTGKQFRLPTEAEWEYACRSGGKDEEYCGGNDIDSVAWYGGNSGSKTHPVGQKQPNGLGIYDMSGNVWQWVSDWYGNNYPSSGKNPQGTSEGSDRVVRGGSWGNVADYARAARRDYDSPDYRNNNLGFRLASPVQ